MKNHPGRFWLVIVKTAAAVTLFFMAFVLLYFAAVLTGGLVSAGSGGAAATGDESIYLYNNGRHYDIWIPASCCVFLEDGVPGGQAGQAGQGWYGFGWGDRDFFLNTPYAGDVRPGLLLKALFWPSRSILAVQYSEKSPAMYSASVQVKTDRDTIVRAAELIEGWFQHNQDGLMQIPEESAHPSYLGYSFYEAQGFYSCFFTSNSWVNSVLKKAGLSGGLWTPLTFGVGRGSISR